MSRTRLAHVAAGLALVSHALAGCYSGGQSGGKSEFAQGKIEDICDRKLLGDYLPRQPRTACLTENDFSWHFEIKLISGEDRKLPLEECISGLTKEITGCEFGGSSTYDNWEYTSDPNRGTCADEDDTEPEKPKDIEGFKDCDQQQIESINREVGYATSMANDAKNIMPVDNYYKTLFSQKSRDKVGFEIRVRRIYNKVSAIIGDPQYALAFRCFAKEEGPCAPTAGVPTWAHTDAFTKVVTLCPAWFNGKPMDTNNLIDKCDDPADKTWDYLYIYKQSRAFTIFHEFTHLGYVTSPLNKDYAYGLKQCLALKDGKHENKEHCGGGKCDVTKDVENPDTLAFVAADNGTQLVQRIIMKGRANPSPQTGGWFSDKCGRRIKPKDNRKGSEAGGHDDLKKVTETEKKPEDGKKPNGEETGNETDGGKGALDDKKQTTTGEGGEAPQGGKKAKSGAGGEGSEGQKGSEGKTKRNTKLHPRDLTMERL
ncbi:MAG: hypothetical protein Q9171_006502 [Xanthocarpia ochracea]